jgi:uncharacterized protein (TIGR02147 family)
MDGRVSMIDIYDYLDYRIYLNDYWKAAKKDRPFFSIRFISQRVGINPGYILKVFQGKVHLGLKNIPAFKDLLGLEGKERDYFDELVHFGRAQSEKEIESHFAKLHTIKGIRLRTVAENETEFFQNWYVMALRALLSIFPFDGRNYRELGSYLQPPITAAEARQGVTLLERLGMIRKNEHGFYELTELFISTGEKWKSPVIKNYQRKIMEMGIESLERHDKSIRDISTVTMTFPLDCIPELRERVAAFRQELLSMSEKITGSNSVLQVNIQIFPSAIISKDGSQS